MQYSIAILLIIIPTILGSPQRNIFYNNLPPEVAQRFIQDDDTGSLSYARKLGEAPLSPTGRSFDGRQYFYNGRRIEDPQNYRESTFLANQFHGQDGLGKAKFGYKDYNQAHKQLIRGDGTVKGDYQFTYPNGQVYRASYYADSQGFHVTDNRPRHEVEPVTDTPEVQRAKAEHFRAYNEQAAAVRANNGRYHPDYDRYKDVKGPPRGFYYEFDYPVHLIEPNNARSAYNDQYNNNNNNYGTYNRGSYNNGQYQRSTGF